MKNLPIEGSDITQTSPINGVIHVAGFIRNPMQYICITWEVNGFSGTTKCQAWEGQFEIDKLIKANYRILSVSLEVAA